MLTSRVHMAARTRCVEWALSGRALPGEVESGDMGDVLLRGDGVMLALVDGLGHGPEAAKAADVALEALRGCDLSCPRQVLLHCHNRSRATRGVAMTVVMVDSPTSLRAAGVGNVEVTILGADGRRRASLAVMGGIVGYRTIHPRVTTFGIEPGNTVLMATDGLRAGAGDEPSAAMEVGELADYVLSTYARASDDAMVLVARTVSKEGGG